MLQWLGLQVLVRPSVLAGDGGGHDSGRSSSFRVQADLRAPHLAEWHSADQLQKAAALQLRWVGDNTWTWSLLRVAPLVLYIFKMCTHVCLRICRCCLLSVDTPAVSGVPGSYPGPPPPQEQGNQRAELQTTAVCVQTLGNQTSECVSVAQLLCVSKGGDDGRPSLLCSPAHPLGVSDQEALQNVSRVPAVVQVLLHQQL